jgi:hypothetical protein
MTESVGLRTLLGSSHPQQPPSASWPASTSRRPPRPS